jgi:hypothetical protein
VSAADTVEYHGVTFKVCGGECSNGLSGIGAKFQERALS